MPCVGIKGPEAEAAVVAARLSPIFQAGLGWQCAVQGDGPQLSYAGTVVHTPMLVTPVHRERLELRWPEQWGPDRWVDAEIDTGTVLRHRRCVSRREQLAPTAAALGFPECGLLVHDARGSAQAIGDWPALRALAWDMLDAGSQVALECDIRPHVNPWRLAAIERAALLLVDRTAAECSADESAGLLLAAP